MDARASDYAEETGSRTQSKTNDTPKKKRGGGVVRIALLVIVVAALGAAYYVYSQHAAIYPSTNDAQVGANVVRIAPQVTGTVLKVDVASYSKVKQGQVLVEIDPAPFQAAVDQAEAQLELARQNVEALTQSVAAAKSTVEAQQAVLTNAEAEWKRVSDLVAQGTLPKSQQDSAKSALVQAQSGVAAAKAQLNKAQAALGVTGDKNPNIVTAKAALETAKLNLSYATVTAPVSGIVGEVTIRPGSLAAAGTQLFQIVDTDQWWVDANFKETDLERIRDGQTATIAIDMLPGKTFTGTVKALSPASGAAFSLFPPNNATGNWVKVTQRFPVRVYFKPGADADRVRVGGSATVTVDTGTGAK